MGYKENIINKYKHRRSMELLNGCYGEKYALVGFGQHCVNNLLPVMQYLQLPLKYICCTSAQKAGMISKKYKGVQGVTSLNDILCDDEVSAVFVAATARVHGRMATEIIKAKKALFIEKPPCMDENELEILTDVAKQSGSQHIVVGLQRRFAPATQILKKRLKNEEKHYYHYRYLTGLYPEGDALTNLFIHPLDYVLFLFGPATITGFDVVCGTDGAQTYMLMLKHNEVKGMLELSTAYSWQRADEQLSVNTNKGWYVMQNMEQLEYVPRQSSIWGIPLEKIVRSPQTITLLYGRNGFVPTPVNNQLVSQGFFLEIKTFADMVENRLQNTSQWGLESVKPVYALMTEISRLANTKAGTTMQFNPNR